MNELIIQLAKLVVIVQSIFFFVVDYWGYMALLPALAIARWELAIIKENNEDHD